MLPLAQSSLTFLVYLVIGGIWLIGNLMQQKQAKRKAAEMRRKREEREAEERRTGKKVQPQKASIESELEAFLGRLSGEPPSAPAPKPPPVTRQKPVVDDIQFDTPPPPYLATQRKAAPPPLPPSKAPIQKVSSIGEMDMASSFKQMSEIKDAKEMVDLEPGQMLAQDAIKNVGAMMIDLSACMVSVPMIPMPTIRTVHTQTPRPDLQKRAILKKSLVASFILEPPKALQPSPNTETL